ncbi:MAG: ABC transporter permease [Pseudomonadota bacterium]
MITALRALLSHWMRSPLQLVTLIAGLALATALWSGVQAINAEARASYDEAADRVGTGQYDRLVAEAETPLTTRDFVALRRAGWLVSPQIEGELDGAGIDRPIRLIGIEPLTAPPIGGIDGLGSFPLDDFFHMPGHAIASPDAAPDLRAFGLGVTQSEALDGRIAFVDIGIAQRLLQRGDRIDRLILHAVQPQGLPDIAAVVPHALRVAAQTSTADIARLTDSFHLNLTAFGLLAFAVGLFIVYSAIGLAFEQRRAMFRTLRALGLSLNRLIWLLSAELLLIALIAGSLGIALGYVIAAALLPDVAATLRGLYGAEISGGLAIRPSWWLSGLAMAVAGTFAAGAGALWRLSRLPLLDAGTPQAWAHMARQVIRVMSFAGAGLLGVAAILAVTAEGLVQGFALLAALLVGAALLLPACLDRILRALERISPAPLPAWFWADTRQQVPGLSMALMALLLAIAANIGVSTMVSSFRLTFTGWLDQRLASEIYVTVADAAQAEQMRVLLEGKADAILPLLRQPLELANLPGEVYAVADHPTYSENWPLLAAEEDVWALLREPGYALVNEQLALSQGLSLGDEVPSVQGQKIVGIYSDYGNPAPQVIIGLAAFRMLYPDVRATRFGLRVDPDSVADVMGLLREELPLPQDALADQGRIKAISLRVFEQTFTVTSALNVLTLSVAGFSILMNLLTLSQMRLPQLAPVWALGVTRAELGRMEVARAVALAGFVTVLALPLGLALAWVLLAIVNVAAFGWRLPMFLFPLSYLWLGLAALGAALIAAGWPAIRLARTAPHHLLAVFSSGR